MKKLLLGMMIVTSVANAGFIQQEDCDTIATPEMCMCIDNQRRDHEDYLDQCEDMYRNSFASMPGYQRGDMDRMMRDQERSCKRGIKKQYRERVRECKKEQRKREREARRRK